MRPVPILLTAAAAALLVASAAPAAAQPAPSEPADPAAGEPRDEGSEPKASEEAEDDKARHPSARTARERRRQKADEFKPELVLDTARVAPGKPSPVTLHVAVHGEYQLRYRAMTDVRLEPPIRDNREETRVLGQNQYLYHWLRLSPRLDYRDKLSLVGQIDFPRGLIAGDTTLYATAARDPLDDNIWYEVHPRQLYIEYRSPIGTFRLGQQSTRIGVGILANDGDTPVMFGDYIRGQLNERILFATTPMGKDTPLFVALAGDLVYEDNTADLADRGDRAFQGTAAIGWRTKPAEIAIYGIGRHQSRELEAVQPRATGSLAPFDESLTVGVVDVAGSFNTKVPGAEAYAYGAFEAATIIGTTSYVRSSFVDPIDPRTPREDEDILTFGAVARLGFVHVAKDGRERWGDGVAEIEWGYASGDGDPSDGVTRRFTFDTNHNVGLVLFDHVMGWKTARAATIAGDPAIAARQAPGLQFVPSNGGVFGAMYLNPRFLVRPRPWLDLKAGAVLAQSTADVVDPFHFGALGTVANYDGGDPTKRDLGVEVDAGVEGRIPVTSATTVQLGAEGGVLFPGGAFDDALDVPLDNQYLANVRAGLQF